MANWQPAINPFGTILLSQILAFGTPSEVMTDQVLSEAYKCDLPSVSPKVRDSLLQFSNNPSGGEISVKLEWRIVTAG